MQLVLFPLTFRDKIIEYVPREKKYNDEQGEGLTIKTTHRPKTLRGRN